MPSNSPLRGPQRATLGAGAHRSGLRLPTWLAYGALAAACSGADGQGMSGVGETEGGPTVSYLEGPQSAVALERSRDGGDQDNGSPVGSTVLTHANVAITEQPEWAIQYQTTDSRSDWLELNHDVRAVRSLPSRSPAFARSHIAWLRDAQELESGPNIADNPRASTALWSSTERLYYRGLHAWFDEDAASKPQLIGGVMRVKAMVRNDGDELLDVASMELSTSIWEGLAKGSTIDPWQLTSDISTTDLPPEIIAECDTTDAQPLEPGATAIRTFCSALLPPSIVLGLLRESAGVTVVPVTSSEPVAAPSSVEVYVQYGGYRDAETHRVALDEPRTAERIFSDLGLTFTEGHNFWPNEETDVPEITGFGLTQVQGIAADASGNSYFVVTLSRSSQPLVTFNPHAASYRFANIELRPGDVFRVGLVRDSDHDGLTAELEEELGCSDDMPDSDMDGLDDGLEVLGWKPENAPASVDSDPTIADTDADGISDSAEFEANTDPRF